MQLIAFGYLCGTRLIPVCDVAGIGEGVDGRRTVRRGPEDSGRIGNGPNAGGITRDLIDLQQIGNEADSIEDVRRSQATSEIVIRAPGPCLISNRAFLWNAPVKSGDSTKLVHYVSITGLG